MTIVLIEYRIVAEKRSASVPWFDDEPCSQSYFDIDGWMFIDLSYAQYDFFQFRSH